MYETLVDYNDHNDALLTNYKIWPKIRKVIAKEEVNASNITLDAHNVSTDNFCQTPITPNTQGDNEKMILESERLNNPDAMAETLKGLTFNDAVY